MADGLTLTRKVDEKVILLLPDGRRAEVWVNEIRRNQVRVSFDAPRDIKILREELLEGDEG